MIASVIAWLETTAMTVPLSMFVLIGGIVEEILAPIPSPLVATLAGSIAKAQGMGIPGLLWICALATLSKTIGASLFYFLGDKIEDLIIPRFGKYIGVTHDDLESFGERFKGTWKDIGVLLLLRSIPMMPSTPISAVCGVLKISKRTFFLGTYIGFYIREMTFIVLGYTGLAALDSLMSGIDTAETFFKILIVGGAFLFLAWLWWKRKTGNPAQWLKRR